MTTDLGRSDAHGTPEDVQLDASDRLLTAIAAGTTSTGTLASDPLTELLRTASGPAGSGELVGEEQFVAAVSTPAEQRRRAGASPAGLVGKAVAAKVAVIAAVTVLGIAGAGAATGVILRVANDDAPQPLVTVDDPDATPPDAEQEWQLDDSTRDRADAGAGADPVRVRTCAAATSPTGLEQLARAASVASTTAADYCRGTGTAADPDRPDEVTGEDGAPTADDPSSSESPRSGTDTPTAEPGPPSGAGGSSNGNGGGNTNRPDTPGTPNANANPKATNGATNGVGNQGATPNGGGNGNGTTTPGTPNANADPKATNGATNGVGRTVEPRSGARAVAPTTPGGPGKGSAPDADAGTGRHDAPRGPQAPDASTPRGAGIRTDRGR
jgi:hypothetical protein